MDEKRSYIFLKVTFLVFLAAWACLFMLLMTHSSISLSDAAESSPIEQRLDISLNSGVVSGASLRGSLSSLVTSIELAGSRLLSFFVSVFASTKNTFSYSEDIS